MALDDFRRTDLIIDKATQRIDWQAPLRAVQGEYNGRSLRVQLTNNGIVEPQTAQLLFGFYCAVNHKEGVYDMTAVDLSKGIYEVFYPSDMLLEYGTVACTIKIIENAGSSENESHITILDGISVEVAENSTSGQAEVAENSIRVFDKALIDISAHERRILLMELNFQELSQMLTLNIPNMDVAVSTRATQASVDELTSKLAELDADVGETADTGGGVNKGTVMAKLNAILQSPKVIRGVATFSVPSNEDGTNVSSHTISLPQTITPQYANVSVVFSTSVSFTAGVSMVVLNVTTKSIGVRVTTPRALNGYTLTVSWQVVGGVV